VQQKYTNPPAIYIRDSTFPYSSFETNTIPRSVVAMQYRLIPPVPYYTPNQSTSFHNFTPPPPPPTSFLSETRKRNARRFDDMIIFIMWGYGLRHSVSDRTRCGGGNSDLYSGDIRFEYRLRQCLSSIWTMSTVSNTPSTLHSTLYRPVVFSYRRLP